MEEDKTLKYLKNFLNSDLQTFSDSLEELVKDYERKSNRLNKIIKTSDKQYAQLIKLNEELDEYKNHLEIKVEEEIEKRKQHEKILFQQSKMAAMGEMMDAVAHQWKQPIGIISLKADILKYDYASNEIDEKYIDEFEQSIKNQINHMINTLDEFRTFFRPNKDIKEFDVKEMIEKVLFLLKDELIKNQIVVEVNDYQNFSLNGIENEFKHLILNLINNSKDAFNEKEIKKRKITINLLADDDSKTIEVLDNAGGIPEDIIEDIFKANITSKDEDKGTGIGLYMSSQIAEKHNGTLSVENIEDGAKFIFRIG
jgi:signal transduction histidine kinase